MNGLILADISRSKFGMAMVAVAVMLSISVASGQESAGSSGNSSEIQSFRWNFGRQTDTDYDGRPDGWKRTTGVGFPRYVKVSIVPHDPEFAKQINGLDRDVVHAWKKIRNVFKSLPPLPPPILDAMVDRYLRIDLDGGQAELTSPKIAASPVYQYRFSCRTMTEGLRHDSARAEFVFLGATGEEITVHSSPIMRGTQTWTQVSLDFVRPPVGATQMFVRLIVERAENGLEDIRGTIGFDDIRIDQYAQLQITTDQPLGVYAYGQPVVTTAKIMGMPAGRSQIEFRILDHRGHEVAAKRTTARHQSSKTAEADAQHEAPLGSEQVTWIVPSLDPGFYRMTASTRGNRATPLETETTFVVIDQDLGGPPHGSFGWSLPSGSHGILPKDFANWLVSLGVAWVKYPCWLASDDSAGGEQLATLLGRLQDAEIRTVGMLDAPPAQQHSLYGVHGRQDLVASQLFRDVATWKPLLTPVMDRLSLQVQTWQLGSDRDHSFLGRANLRDAIRQVSTGLRGYGQPIDVAISWPWLESELPDEESSWHAVCRSTEPPLSAQELDAFLSLADKGSRRDGPRTWLMLDPISASKYDRDSRIRDLVFRMATVRSHSVQAAFLSDPRDPQRGLLTPNGRPDELLLPWRTTSRLIGDLRKTGTLHLRSRAKNIVFSNNNRAVLVLWSAEPTEELIYLGDDVRAVDVWGQSTELPVEPIGDQPVQRIKIGPMPTFVIGVDPTMLAFRMSVDVKEKQLDSFLGQVQKLSVTFTNPTSASLTGKTRIEPPKTWTVESPSYGWEALGRRPAIQSFDVVLSNAATIGKYELPIQFQIDTEPPKLFTVYRNVSIGPEGLDLTVNTKLLASGELRVRIELTNRTRYAQSYDCVLFPPPGRQYKRRLITIRPDETQSREILWDNGAELIGKRMLLRAIERDGRRVLNYSIDVTR
jgi:hypothetical protein